MEVKQKIETRVLRNAAGHLLRLDYWLLARMGPAGQPPEGPFGLEVILTDREGIRRERCRNLTDDYRKAVGLIHVFAANHVLPVAMLAAARSTREELPGGTE